MVADSMELTDVEVFVDAGLADQIVCLMLDFSGTKLFLTVDDLDDSIVLSKVPPRDLLDEERARRCGPV